MRADDDGRTTPPSTGHPTDDELIAICFAGADDSHLAACEVCRSRYAVLVRSLEEIRADAVREADTMFTTERLAAQRDRILRRLERVRPAAQIVRFPDQRAAAQATPRAPVVSRQWIATAAAAGLVAGLLLGQWVDIAPRAPSGAPAAVTTRTVASEPVMVSAGPADDDLLVLIEDALTSRRAAELQTLDALTSPELTEVALELP